MFQFRDMSHNKQTIERRLKRRLEREAQNALLEEEIICLASRKVDKSNLEITQNNAEVEYQDVRPDEPPSVMHQDVPSASAMEFPNEEASKMVSDSSDSLITGNTTATSTLWDISEYICDEVSECSSDGENSDSLVGNRDSDLELDVEESLKNSLIVWSLKNNITHNATTELLGILKSHGHDTLPKKATTLLDTPRSQVQSIFPMGSGTFWYHGILECLKSNFQTSMAIKVNNEWVVFIDVSIDGISPFKVPRVKTSLWPIAGRIVCKNMKTKPFVIALWCGSKKEPDSVNEFLGKFVEECKTLMEGFELNGIMLKLKINRVIADAPAREFLKQVKNHNSKVSCERCDIRSFRLNNRMVFDAKSVGNPRTDLTFRERVDPEHHTGYSPLENIIGMVSQFPLDRMHLVDLGAMRRIFIMLLDPKASPAKLRNVEIHTLNDYALLICAFIPSEFNRVTKLISEWKTYKASEFRRFLHYDGILLLFLLSKEFPHRRDVYDCFLLLSCAIRILSDENLCNDYIQDARELLQRFVEYSASVFGQHFVVYNIHHLLHLPDDCEESGPLDNFSAYLYESYLGRMKYYLRAPGRAVPQIVNRIFERENNCVLVDNDDSEEVFSQPHDSGPSDGLTGTMYRACKINDFKIRTYSDNDKYCLSKSGDVIVVKNIIRTRSDTYFVGNSFIEKEPFFVYPLDSTCLHIYRVSKISGLRHWLASDITRKCVLLPINPRRRKYMYNEGCLAIAMLHQA